MKNCFNAIQLTLVNTLVKRPQFKSYTTLPEANTPPFVKFCHKYTDRIKC